MNGLYFWMMSVGFIGTIGFAFCVPGFLIEYWGKRPKTAIGLAVVCLILSAGFSLMAGFGNELFQSTEGTVKSNEQKAE